MVRFIARRLSASAIAGVAALLATTAGQARAQAPAFGSAVMGGITQGGCDSPHGSFNFLNNSSCYYAPSAGSRISDTSSTSAVANLGAGFVSVSVTGVLGGPDGILGSAGAHALIWDTLTFSGAAPGAIVTLTMTGDAVLLGNARMNATAILQPLSDTDLTNTPLSLLAGNYNNPVLGGPTYSLQQTFHIINGAMFLAIGVDAGAGVNDAGPNESGFGQASINDPFHFDLPVGVTFTSAYQQSLLPGVPEPATWAMLLLGFGGVGAALRTRRRRGAVAA